MYNFKLYSSILFFENTETHKIMLFRDNNTIFYLNIKKKKINNNDTIFF